MKSFFLIVLSFLSIICLESCNCSKDEDLDRIHIYFSVPEGFPVHKDSVQVFNEKGELVYPGPVVAGSISFNPYVFPREIPLDSMVIETYYVHYRLNGLDIDTLLMEYVADINDCNDKEFDYVQIHYNDELVLDKTNHSQSIYFEINK